MQVRQRKAFGRRVADLQTVQVIIGINIGYHQTDCLIAVDDVVKHHSWTTRYGDPRPAGRVKEGITAVRTLEGVEASASTTAGAKHQHTEQNKQ